MVPTETLSEIPFFGRLAESERSMLSPLSNRRRYRAGDVIFGEGQEPDALRVLVKGLVSFRDETSAFGAARDGDVFGIGAIVGRDAVYPHSAVALEDCEVVEIDASRLLALCETVPALGVHVLHRFATVLAQRLSAARQQLRSRLEPGSVTHG